MKYCIGLTTAAVLIAGTVAAGQARVNVVTTLQDYAAIAREVGGDRIEAAAIVPGAADAHFIKPKPSYAIMLRSADLFAAPERLGNEGPADGAGRPRAGRRTRLGAEHV